MKINQIIVNENIDEGENWSKYNNKRAGGMSKKSVSSYRRSHPGSKIQTAVTTKPSKLKKGSKSAKRRASFCARMRGMKKHRTGAKTARDPNSNINKSLRRWHCESVEDMQQLIMIAEQKINEAKNLAQQAAIAVNMKKKHKKPKSQRIKEDILSEMVPNDQWYIVMHGNLDLHGTYHGKGDDVTGPLPKVQASAQLHKLHPYDTHWTIVPASAMQNKQMDEGNENEQSKYLQGAKDIIKGADPHHIARVRNLDPDTLQRYVKLVWDKIDSKEYNYRKPDLAEVKDDEDDGLIGGRYTPEQWAKMINNLKRKAQEQDAKKKQQEQPKDLGESSIELNNILTLSGNNK
jgi:hypothetical protein